MCPFWVRCCVVSIKYQTKLYISLTDSLEDKRCTGSAVRLWEPEGFLQNPDYPAAGEYTACHWRIEPSPRTSVHLVLHDLASARRSHGRCDGGLHISVSVQVYGIGETFHIEKPIKIDDLWKYLRRVCIGCGRVTFSCKTSYKYWIGQPSLQRGLGRKHVLVPTCFRQTIY